MPSPRWPIRCCRAAPDLEAALGVLPGATAELRALLPELDLNLDRLPATLTRTPAVAADASALIPVLRVGLADVNPMLAYLAPYAKDAAAFAANAAQVVTASGASTPAGSCSSSTPAPSPATRSTTQGPQRLPAGRRRHRPQAVQRDGAPGPGGAELKQLGGLGRAFLVAGVLAVVAAAAALGLTRLEVDTAIGSLLPAGDSGRRRMGGDPGVLRRRPGGGAASRPTPAERS